MYNFYNIGLFFFYDSNKEDKDEVTDLHYE